MSSKESTEVQEFIDVGEYGLALETLCAIIVEEGKTIPWGTYEQMSRLFDKMDLELDLLEQVKKHVDQSQTAD